MIVAIDLSELPRVDYCLSIGRNLRYVVVDIKSFKQHVRRCKIYGTVNEDLYRRQNSDVARAIDMGLISSCTEHYLRTGYIERRQVDIISISEAKKQTNAVHISDMPKVFGNTFADGKLESVVLEVDDLLSHINSLAIYGSIDEQFYMSQYPDVQIAVKAGKYRNALSHFLKVGYVEGRRAR